MNFTTTKTVTAASLRARDDRNGGARDSARVVAAHQVRDHVEPPPCAQHLLDRPFHRRTIARISREEHHERVRRRAGKRAEVCAHLLALCLIADGDRDVRALREIRPYHRSTDVGGRAGKYYGVGGEIEHRREYRLVSVLERIEHPRDL